MTRAPVGPKPRAQFLGDRRQMFSVDAQEGRATGASGEEKIVSLTFFLRATGFSFGEDARDCLGEAWHGARSSSTAPNFLVENDICACVGPSTAPASGPANQGPSNTIQGAKCHDQTRPHRVGLTPVCLIAGLLLINPLNARAAISLRV